MILKEKLFKSQTDPLLKAGDDAEKQMAFYLKRDFGKPKDVFVINDLRISHKGEIAQIDHLLVTQYGLFIIESKSVHGTVAFNQHGDWVRESKGNRQGMPSPIKQAEAQGKIVKELMRDNDEKLLGTLLGIQKGFRYCPIEIRVAISDTGIIERGYDESRVLKADMVCESISRKVKEWKSTSSLLSLKLDTGWEMKLEEAKRVADFLVASHQPKEPRKTERKKATSPEAFVPRVGAICPKCNKFPLERGSIKRNDGTETDYLRCTGYPLTCDALFPLVAVSASTRAVISSSANSPQPKSEGKAEHLKNGETCPQCKTGKLIQHKGRYGKPDFLGCSNYNCNPSCNFMRSLDNLPSRTTRKK